jgi:uncharacterized protein YyaL (SSP411 family)
MHTHTNALINETSPYLLQHAHNPVNWQPWRDSTWQKAREQDRLVIVSIGYSACHWCHVMEHESFEDSVVADIMNDHFVNIKVDREERPDVDQVYMDAVQIITGHGGWPLNAICLPDGRPVYAGTYFPKDNWKQVLLYFVDYYKRDKAYLEEQAAKITEGINALDTVSFGERAMAFDKADRLKVLDSITQHIDFREGGRQGAPKFPMPVNYQYLLTNHYYTGEENAMKAVKITLDKMMKGGIYDQAGGGFARYSVDAAWTVPHFEKMLYDNAQLVSLYSEAYTCTGDENYRRVAEETLEFIQRELTDKSGGFYSALDADSEGEEGKFYVWTYQELEQLLGADFKDFLLCYDVTPSGNFEHKNNLVRTDYAYDEKKISGWKALLLKERGKRIRPSLDDKILTSWNALMCKGLVDAYNATGNAAYLKRAEANANFLAEQMVQADGSILRNYKNGVSNINGFLDDYSFSCEAFLALYETTFEEQWLKLAERLTAHAMQHFYNPGKGLFYYTSEKDAPLIARKTETGDNVIPSSNSSMMKVLFKIGLLIDNREYLEVANAAMTNLHENATRYSSFYANWALLLNYCIQAPYEVAIVGSNAVALRKEFAAEYLPNVLYLGSEGESQLPLLQGKYKAGETYIYVCRDKQCQLPVKTVAEALAQIAK